MADATLHFPIDPLEVTASSIGAMTLVIETVGSGGGGGGVTSHSALTNLDADDHLHYLTAARGDARYDPLNTAAAALAAHTAAPDAHPGYATDGELATALAGKSNSDHLHPGVYDPSGTAAALIATLLPLLRYGLQTPWPLVSGSVYDAAITSAYTIIAGAAGRIDLYPVVFAFATAINLFSINVTAAVAGALVRTLVYAADANGMPNARLFSGATDLDCSAAGVKSHAESFTFQANTLYWIGVHHSANPTLTAIAAGGLRHLGLASANATTALTGIRRTGVDYASGPPATWGFNSAELVSGGAMSRVTFTIA